MVRVSIAATLPDMKTHPNDLRLAPASSALRRGRVSLPGQIYLITTRTKHGEPVFADFCNARLTIRVLQTYAPAAATLAYVLMPDHLHWLIQLHNRLGLSQVVAAVKASSAYLINQRGVRRGAMWLSGFHDHAVRREEDLASIARYLVLNPVRSGLVKSWRDYPHWDAIWLP